MLSFFCLPHGKLINEALYAIVSTKRHDYIGPNTKGLVFLCNKGSEVGNW